jgi:hypothetical protein
MKTGGVYMRPKWSLAPKARVTLLRNQEPVRN